MKPIEKCRRCFIGILFLIILAEPVLAEVQLRGCGTVVYEDMVNSWGQDINDYFDFTIHYKTVQLKTGLQYLENGDIEFLITESTEFSSIDIEKRIAKIPFALNAIVVAYNLPNLKYLKITPVMLSQIGRGLIKNWNHWKFHYRNPKNKLPKLDLTFIYNSDEDPATYFYTDYLSRFCSQWERQYGRTMVFTSEYGVGISGFEKVIELLKKIPGSIGYLPYNMAVQNNLQIAAIMNRNGRFVLPITSSIRASAEPYFQNSKNASVLLTDSNEEGSYPLSSIIYFVWPKEVLLGANVEKANRAAVEVMRWILNNGLAAVQRNHFTLPTEQSILKIETSLPQLVEQ